MARKYLIETFGCQMNVHDSERMAGLLDQAGYEPTTDDRDADVIVINTCSVREHAEEKLYTRLGELRVLQQETGRRPVVAVAGCVAQQEGESLLSKTNGHVIDVVIGTQRLKMLPIAASSTPPRSPFPARRHQPLGRRDASRSGSRGAADPVQGLRHHHRGLQRPLRVLRRAVHARPRAHARQGRHPRRRPRGGRVGPQGRFSSSGRS